MGVFADRDSPVTYVDRPAAPETFFALFETTGWKELYRCTTEDIARALAGRGIGSETLRRRVTSTAERPFIG